jgi:alkanesulfonate monooxygenase SsuD/methylene tetrahydromethanopterin reductase-like flavin-dependent oxidoreductase (luciferase family)
MRGDLTNPCVIDVPLSGHVWFVNKSTGVSKDPVQETHAQPLIEMCMKFGLFYQLPCATTQDAATRYQETIEQIVYAEELGFDTAWLAELHFNPLFSIMPAPLLVAAALAQRTTRIRLGTAVLLLPLQHPVRTAEEAAVVDLLSQGRLDLGVGRGMIAIHFQGFNVPREESRERFEEALTIITHAWTREVFQFDGKYYHVPETAVVPKPMQKPHPPLRIAANPYQADDVKWTDECIAGAGWPSE